MDRYKVDLLQTLSNHRDNTSLIELNLFHSLLTQDGLGHPWHFLVMDYTLFPRYNLH